ncbi:MAG: DUF3570 domain-containing protein [Gammaproteobacteria bacterium]|nr:DUF3570 domain-containing protein [Gammaproteobacteria bacterium]MDH5729873.1 DUF3570 domain-containing protein [Gammaproteobacteria bacterium]
MQLKNKKSVRQSLASATASLLAISGQANGAAGNEIEFNASTLYYAEDKRVTVNKFQNQLRIPLREEEFLNIDVIYDTMTGATPNGSFISKESAAAFVAGTSQSTYTFASGFSIPISGGGGGADKIAVADWLTEFEDKRIALTTDLEKPLTSHLLGNYSASISREEDYTSVGASTQFKWDINQRRTTLSLGANFNNDQIHPSFGVYEPGSAVRCDDSKYFPGTPTCGPARTIESANKVVSSFLAGITQIWNRSSIVQFNYSYTINDGFLTDPYKMTSISEVVPDQTLREKRPDHRVAQSLYLKVVNVITPSQKSLNSSARFFWDDWGIRSLTIDSRFIRDLSSKHTYQIHARANYQTAADFFTLNLKHDETTQIGALPPEFFSSDHRIGEQLTLTSGAKYMYNTKGLGKIGMRVEYMYQNYYENNLPNMGVWIIQALLNFKF